MRYIDWVDPYDYNRYQLICEQTGIDFTGDPGLTQQAPAEEQDINVIMRRFGVTDGSVLPRWQDPNAIYGDFSELPSDPVEAAEIIRRGEVQFQTLPAKIRNKFETGAQLFNWLHNEQNYEEAVSLGLLTVRAAPTPAPAPIVPPEGSQD